ncbi:hypothetical protein M23134_02193 [Microscilla marina ATCC 23134]|uniref:Uncharacterized protein n=1 Tax=Microscilla marina ATCC 23134 TaxID=313606 RepID=A1ZNH2_MICM2|nr:hypothetical protein M23134_02193 [Microscilla marina ATCC 23134]
MYSTTFSKITVCKSLSNRRIGIKPLRLAIKLLAYIEAFLIDLTIKKYQ